MNKTNDFYHYATDLLMYLYTSTSYNNIFLQTLFISNDFIIITD